MPTPDLEHLLAAAHGLVQRAESLLVRLDAALPHAATAPDWSASVAYRYRRRGSVGVIEPVRHVASIALADLKEVEPQKEKLLRNTAQFVAGRSANNVLLTGARGTGKSSLIKACLNEFAPMGLRLIEVDKADLVDLQDLVDLVAERPERFIVFCDDLSFDEGEAGYKALKSVLDGSVAQASDEEKISLSERFGLWVSFYPFTQAEYLAIAAQWLRSFGVDEAAIAAARQETLVWALERGSRSGRVAYQFARDFAGRRSD
jgi:uncharacterized protein